MTPLRIALFAILWLLLGIWGLVGGNLLFGFGGAALALAFLVYAWVLRRGSGRGSRPRD